MLHIELLDNKFIFNPTLVLGEEATVHEEDSPTPTLTPPQKKREGWVGRIRLISARRVEIKNRVRVNEDKPVH